MTCCGIPCPPNCCKGKAKSTAQKVAAKDGKTTCCGIPCPPNCCKDKAATSKATKIASAQKANSATAKLPCCKSKKSCKKASKTKM